MRLSSIKGDPGWKPDNVLRKYDVYFNGTQIFDAEIADTEKGCIKRIRRVRNPITRQIQTFRYPFEFGTVEIKEKTQ